MERGASRKFRCAFLRSIICVVLGGLFLGSASELKADDKREARSVRPGLAVGAGIRVGGLVGVEGAVEIPLGRQMALSPHIGVGLWPRIQILEGDVAGWLWSPTAGVEWSLGKSHIGWVDLSVTMLRCDLMSNSDCPVCEGWGLPVTFIGAGYRYEMNSGFFVRGGPMIGVLVDEPPSCSHTGRWSLAYDLAVGFIF